MPIGPSGSSKVVLRYEGSDGDTKGVVSAGGVVSPDWYIGFGWYIYFYIGPQDWGWFTGLALPALSVFICGVLEAGGISGVVCGLIAVALIYVFATYAAPPPAYCKEIKFNHVGTLRSVKNVQMSCWQERTLSRRLFRRWRPGEVLALGGVVLLVFVGIGWVLMRVFTPTVAADSSRQFLTGSFATFAVLETVAWLDLRRIVRRPSRGRLLFSVGLGMLISEGVLFAGAALVFPDSSASVVEFVTRAVWVPLATLTVGVVVVIAKSHGSSEVGGT
ncbi:MAG: hypothetical protein GXP34_10660 [Actinobacteria bacterium]|nr:hypothetical protein [Actinomycetota bacterium]